MDSKEFNQRIIEKFRLAMNCEKYSDEFYNLFFYANTCHVCKLYNRDLVFSSRKKCSRCKMISYCSKVHQKEHWPQHKELCDLICKLLEETKEPIFFTNSTGLETAAWLRMKMRFLKLVQSKMIKNLLPYEQQMFKFPRNCIICHETNPDLLSDCKSCLSASFCKDHKNNPKHKELCPSFALCYRLDMVPIYATLGPALGVIEGFLGKSIMKVIPYHTEVPHLPKSMKHFLQTHVKMNLRIDPKFLPNKHVPNFPEIYISEYFTNPMTLLYAMERLDFPSEPEIVIHVIGAKVESEVDGAEFWEILLHRLPRLSSLKIIFIGKELFQKKVSSKVCNRCTSKNKNLTIEVYNLPYDVYFKQRSFVKPNIVLGYNLGLHKYVLSLSEDTWKDSFIALTKLSCPVVLTSTGDRKAQETHLRIRRLIGESTTYSCCERNPFAGLRPYRDFETDGLYYKNRYISTYPRLTFTANKDKPYKDLKCSCCKEFICYVEVNFESETRRMMSCHMCIYCLKEFDLAAKNLPPTKAPATLRSKLISEYDTLFKENRELKEKVELLTIELEELQNSNKRNTSDEILTAKLVRMKNFLIRNLKELKEQLQQSSLKKK